MKTGDRRVYFGEKLVLQEGQRRRPVESSGPWNAWSQITQLAFTDLAETGTRRVSGAVPAGRPALTVRIVWVANSASVRTSRAAFPSWSGPLQRGQSTFLPCDRVMTVNESL